jgi:hypothetical protein
MIEFELVEIIVFVLVAFAAGLIVGILIGRDS